jgi:hypothetical protein
MVLSLTDGELTLINERDEMRSDLRVPEDVVSEEVSKRIQQHFEKPKETDQLLVTVQTVLRSARITDCRVVSSK